MSIDTPFLASTRLLLGPWQAFERDIARLLLLNGFSDVRIVGGTGDHGGDVLGVQDSRLWVVQCKHTTSSSPPVSAIQEVINAGRFYAADKLVIATSRPMGEAFLTELNRINTLGYGIQTLEPWDIEN